VRDAGVGHVDPLSNGSDLDGVGTALDEQFFGCLEDLELRHLGAAADTFARHAQKLTLTCLDRDVTLSPQGKSIDTEERPMPMIDLTLPKGRFDRPEQEALAAELTRLIIHWESGTDRPGYDKAAWAFVQEADLIQVGGRSRIPGGRQIYRVVVSVPKGSLDDRRRAGLMSDVAHAVIATEGTEPTPEDLMRVWCIVNEVPDGNWGVGPGPLRLRDLAARFGVRPGEDRWDELRFDQR